MTADTALVIHHLDDLSLWVPIELVIVAPDHFVDVEEVILESREADYFVTKSTEYFDAVCQLITVGLLLGGRP